MNHNPALTMDTETAKGIFTRVYQSLDMLHLIDENKDNSQLTVADLYKQFQDRYHEKDHFFFNQQFFMGCLLAFIVLPQSLFDNIIDDQPITSLGNDWHLSKLNITTYMTKMPKNSVPKGATRWVAVDDKGKEQLKLKWFLRKVRNSISHARFSVKNDADLTFVFKDQENSNQPVNFSAELPLNDLYGFCKRFNELIVRGGSGSFDSISRK